MKPLILSQINLNGTAREALVAQKSKVLQVLYAQQKAAPNGRDYQLRAAEFAPAQEAWLERMQALDEFARRLLQTVISAFEQA
jgi:hypothetical protein